MHPEKFKNQLINQVLLLSSSLTRMDFGEVGRIDAFVCCLNLIENAYKMVLLYITVIKSAFLFPVSARNHTDIGHSDFSSFICRVLMQSLGLLKDGSLLLLFILLHGKYIDALMFSVFQCNACLYW